MDKKSRGYIVAIVLTILAVSLIVYEVKLKGANANVSNSNKKKEVTIVQKENLKEDNLNKEIRLSKQEEDALKGEPIGERVKNNLKYSDKEEIHFKMINAVDNFKTCKGEFMEEGTIQNSRMKSTFAVDVENKSSVSVIAEEGKKPITLIYHNDKRKVFDDNDKSYREFEERQFRGKPTIVRPIRLFIEPSLKREDIGYLGVSSNIICAEVVPTYLFIYEDWNYTDSTFLGRDVYKLNGVIDPNLSSNMQGKFSLFMDKETGIILQFLLLDDNGKIKEKLECTKLEVNTPIDESSYNKNTSGYVKK